MSSSELDVGQNIATVNDKRIRPDPCLGILDAAAGFKEIRLVNKLYAAAGSKLDSERTPPSARPRWWVLMTKDFTPTAQR